MRGERARVAQRVGVMAAECRENPFCPTLPPFGGKVALAVVVYVEVADVYVKYFSFCINNI